jgi:prophage regulatory protein
MIELLKRPEVERRTQLSRSSLYLLMSKGRFPAPIKLSERAVAWRASDVDEWIRQRIEASEGRAA